jgi:hypothetical protein
MTYQQNTLFLAEPICEDMRHSRAGADCTRRPYVWFRERPSILLVYGIAFAGLGLIGYESGLSSLSRSFPTMIVAVHSQASFHRPIYHPVACHASCSNDPLFTLSGRQTRVHLAG